MPARSLNVRFIRRTVLCGFVVLAVLFSQAAAHLHALSHASFDLAKSAGKDVPSTHSLGQCVAFHAVDSALPVADQADVRPALETPSLIPTALPAPLLQRVAFDSRAPPENS